MDRRELEIMLNDAFDRGIVTARAVEGIYPPAVTVGILDDLGREIDFGHEGSGLTVFLPGIEDDARFAGSCKALGGKVPQNTYRMELVSAIAGELMGAESATALSALESALDRARRRGYCVFDRGIHDDVPDPGLVYLCSTYPAAVRLKDSLDFVRAQGNEPDRHALGTYRMVDGYCIMGGLDEVPLADAYAVDAALIEDWGVGDAVFRITDLKAKTFSYAVDADGDGGRGGPRPPSPPAPGRPPRPRRPRNPPPARSPPRPARPRRTRLPDTDTMVGADAPAGALAYTHKRSTAHPHISTHPHPHICVKGDVP